MKKLMALGKSLEPCDNVLALDKIDPILMH